MFQYYRMKLRHDERMLLVSECVRIAVTIVILCITNVPVFLKIVLIMVADSIDCTRVHSWLVSENWIDCNSMTYQKTDKVTDTICYMLLLVYLLNNGRMSINYSYLIILLFIYRTVGVYMFLISEDRSYLFYFPNFFLEITLGLALTDYFKYLKPFKGIFLVGILLHKVAQEYYMHVYKPQLK